MIPLATTTVAIAWPTETGDPYETPTGTQRLAGVRAHVSAPVGSDARLGGDKEVVDAVLYTDVTDPAIDRTSIVVDETTGTTWRVVWAVVRHGLGLDHQTAGVVTVAGAANG